MGLPILDRNSIHYQVLVQDRDIHYIESKWNLNIMLEPVPGHSFSSNLIRFLNLKYECSWQLKHESHITHHYFLSIEAVMYFSCLL